MSTAAENLVAFMADRPHPSSQSLKLRELRATYPDGYQDTGFTETFTLADGSRVEYNHTANPGHCWRAIGEGEA